MIKYFNKKWMDFKDLFKDTNDINEKNLVGFASFIIMVLFATADIITGFFGKDLAVNEFIYNSFVIVTLGSFGISEVGKVFGKNTQPKEELKKDEKI